MQRIDMWDCSQQWLFKPDEVWGKDYNGVKSPKKSIDSYIEECQNDDDEEEDNQNSVIVKD